jgi:hypothetical protein
MAYSVLKTLPCVRTLLTFSKRRRTVTTNRIATLFEERSQEVHNFLGKGQLAIMDMEPYQMTQDMFEELAGDLLQQYQNRNPFAEVTLLDRILLEQYLFVFGESCKR